MSASAPPAPNYGGAAQQQGQANQQAWQNTNVANHANTQTPWGSYTWTQDQMENPFAGMSGDVGGIFNNVGQAYADAYNQQNPGQWNLDVSMNPQQQQALDAQQQMQLNQSQNALALQGQIQNSIQNGLNPSAATPWAQIPQGGPIQGGIQGTQLQNQYDFGGAPGMPDSAQWANQQGIDAAYNQYASRLNPQWDQAYNRQRSELINQGLDPSSEAYQTQMGNFGRAENDAYQSAMNAAVGQGAQIGSQMFGQGMAAHQQGANEAMAQGNFWNQAAGQQFGQNLAQGQFANQAQAQGFGQDMASAAMQDQQHQGQMGEQAWMNMYPIQMQQALMNGQQVNMPQQLQTPQSGQYQAAPYFAAENAGANYNMNLFNQQNQNTADIMNGIGGLLSGGLGFMFSDKRLKKNIRRGHDVIPGVPSARWNWRDTGEADSGVIAQDVEKRHPEAVREDPNGSGYKQVDYGFLFDKKFKSRRRKKGKG